MPGRGLRVRPEELRVYYPIEEDTVMRLEIQNLECVNLAVKVRTTTTGVTFSDVFFSVAPGEVKTLTVFFRKYLVRRRNDHLTLCVAPVPRSAGESESVEQLWTILQNWSEIEVPITYMKAERKTRSKLRPAREEVDEHHAKKNREKKKSAKPQRPLLFMEKVRLIKQREAENQKKKNADKQPKE